MRCWRLWLLVFSGATGAWAQPRVPPTYHQDVAPVLERHCVSCHGPGGIGPMALNTYRQVRPWAAAIREAVKLRQMPPWFADPRHGHFANDPRLSDEEIGVVEAWVKAGAPAGQAGPVARPAELRAGQRADLVLQAPRAFPVPAGAVIDYQYLVLPLALPEDRWVQAAEVRPSDRSVVHHAVLYVREPGSAWLREAVPGVPYAPRAGETLRQARGTTADILAIYTPGAPAMVCPPGMAKKLPAGSDLVLQLHYTSRKTAASDRPEVRLTFAAAPPARQILTLQMGRDDLAIPPGEREYRTSVAGRLPGDALLLSLFPHMHLRGVAFDFDLVSPEGQFERLLSVRPYRFHWQLNYVLATPRPLRKGTLLRWTGTFDNSAGNRFNPDPTAEVRWGEQSWDEMMIGFFDVAVEPGVDKQRFFAR